MRLINCLIVVIVITLLLAACNPPSAAQEATTPLATTVSPDQLTATHFAGETKAAFAASNAQATQDVKATASVHAKETRTEKTAAARATGTEQRKLTETAVIERLATAAAKEINEALDKLVAAGIIADKSGSYQRLDNYEAELAQINTIAQAMEFKFPLENFVLNADLSWSSASNMANWDRSGCGFIFGDQKDGYFDFIFLSLDGYVRFYRPQPDTNTIYPFSERRYSGKIDRPAGEAEFLLAVVDKRVTVFINGEKVLSEYEGLLKPGRLVYALVSGTNKGYGTRCTWKDVDLWVLE